MNNLLSRSLSAPTLPRRLSDVSLAAKTGMISLLVLLLAIANIMLVKSMLQDFNGVAAIINAAGKMRMLSQKIAYETLGAGRESEAAALQAKVLKSIRDFETAFTTLRNGGQVFGAEVPRISVLHDAHMNDVWAAWVPYRDQVLALLPGAPRCESALNAGSRADCH